MWYSESDAGRQGKALKARQRLLWQASVSSVCLIWWILSLTHTLFLQPRWFPVGQVYFSLMQCSSSSLSKWVCERLYTLTPSCRSASEPAGTGESKQGRGLLRLFWARGVLWGAQAVCFKRRVSASSQVPSALCAHSVSGQLSPRPAFKPLPLARQQSILCKVHAGSELINSQLGSAVAPCAWPTSPPLLTVKDIWMCVGHGSGWRAPTGVHRTVSSVKASQFGWCVAYDWKVTFAFC